MSDPVTMWAAGLTDTGSTRAHNEDTFCISEIGGEGRHRPREVALRHAGPEGFALGVYDGMGGHSSGDMASALAADTVAGALAPISPVEPSRRLTSAVEAANQAIVQSANDPRHRGMGSTATVATQIGEHLYVAQVGDSRAYLLRGRQLVQLTRDDSLVNEALSRGQLRPEDVDAFPHHNVIIQALGMGPTISVAVTHVELRLDDALLLCSDGLHRMVPRAGIRAVMLRHRAPGVTARVLIDEALRAGGNDNVTVVVARFEGPTLRPATPEDVIEERGRGV